MGLLGTVCTGIYNAVRLAMKVAGHLGGGFELEPLEPRTLLSAQFSTGPFISYGLTAIYDEPHVAVDAQGNFVAVWATFASGPPAAEQILAQRFNSAGTPVGSAINVTQIADGFADSPQVAMDAAGDFIITWHDGVKRYDANGGLLGATTGGGVGIYQPAPVAMDAQGNYAIISGDSLQRFDFGGNASGSPITLPTSNGTDLTMNSSGAFAACWISDGVYVQTFAADGTASSAVVQVNQPAGGSTAYLAYVSMNDNGTFAVTWNSTDPAHPGLWVQFFAGDGTPIGTNVQVTSTGYVLNKSVVVQSDGSFVIAWETTSGVFASTFDINGSLTIDAATIASTTTNRKGVSLGAMPNGNLVAVWDEYPSPSNPGSGTITGSIFHPNFVNNPPTASTLSGSLWQDTSLTFTASQFTTAFSDADSADSLEKIKISLLPAHGTLKFNGVAVAPDQEIATAQLSSLTFTPNAGFHGTDSFSYTASDGVDYAVATAAVNLTVYPTGFVVGTLRSYGLTANYDEPQVAADAQGDFVVVWGTDGGSGLPTSQIVAQRFNSDSTPLGGLIEVTDGAVSITGATQVAMDAAGDFVVTWQGGLRRFDFNGNPLGPASALSGSTPYYPNPVAMDAAGNFVVITGQLAQRYDRYGAAVGNAIALTGDHHDIAMNSSGDFVINSWSFDGGGIYARTYSSNGTPTSDLVPVSDPAYPHYTASSFLSMNDNGAFVVIWTGYVLDHPDVYAQLFAANGSPIGANVLVTTEAGVDGRSVAILPDGSYYVGWGGESPGYGVFLQAFNSLGAPVGSAESLSQPTTPTATRLQLGASRGGELIATWEEILTFGYPGTGQIKAVQLAAGTNNHVPTATGFSATMWQATAGAFNAPQFAAGFSDPDGGDTLGKIRIAALPTSGVLKRNGIAVSLNEEIAAGQLGSLTYTSNDTFVGADSFSYYGSDGLGFSASPAVAALTISPNTDVHSPKYRSPIAPVGGNLASFFDAAYYLLHNPDVGVAVGNHQLTPLQHFQMFGQFEGRAPSTFYNESYYLSHNADVALAVSHHLLADGFLHFMNYGYMEARDASSTPGTGAGYVSHLSPKVGVAASFFDEAYYLSRYPDVRRALMAHQVVSGLAHFLAFGQKEGRRPSSLYDEAYYLAHNPDVAAAVAGHSIASGFVHFAFYGFAEGRLGVGAAG